MGFQRGGIVLLLSLKWYPRLIFRMNSLRELLMSLFERELVGTNLKPRWSNLSSVSERQWSERLVIKRLLNCFLFSLCLSLLRLFWLNFVGVG